MQNEELLVSKELVSHLVRNQCPQWSSLYIKKIRSPGSGNFVFRLGDKYVIRFRREISSIKTIEKEYFWIPQIAKFINISISEPIFKGCPDRFYPLNWLVYKWLPGFNPSFEKENEYECLAQDIAHFLNQLHGIKLQVGPSARRGMQLIDRDQQTKENIIKLSNKVDTKQITELWKKLTDLSISKCQLSWIHGDLLPINILIKNNRLSAIIDFSDFGMGDRACDLVIGWSLFNKKSRNTLKKNLMNIDEEIWKRGSAWALSIALVILSNYFGKNFIMESLAKRIINNLIQDE